ncbi:MAG TPA: orotate phosphoribosyltransferase [Gemmataceae bacterium]|jgi:orotate phosphoribosyltransferase|nr:orotate phosphoribosyltransferase [Gemmataceae bacterium]
MERASAYDQNFEDARRRLLDLFKSRALFFGNFTLASGKQSTYYINSKKAIFKAEAVWLLGEVIYQMTRTMNLHAIGGPEVGAIPMATAAAIRYHEHGQSIEAFYVRKQAKGHGSKEMVEGIVRPGDKVAMLDDVLTTGGSVLQAIREVERLDARIAAVICIVDRLEGAREALGHYNFLPIFTIRDFGIEPTDITI